MFSDCTYLHLGLANAVEGINIEDEEEDEDVEDPKPKAEDPKPKAQDPKDLPEEDMAAKLEKQLKDLEAEHDEAIYKGRDDDAEFICKQIKELRSFMKENKEMLKKLASKKGENDGFFSDDDLSIDLSEDEMDIDKLNCKRHRPLN